MGICWDFGHAKLRYEDGAANQLRLAGSRVISTHVHDNYYQKGLHLFPFLGATGWEDTMKALRDIGYQGNLTYEFGYSRIPAALLPSYLRLLRQTGEYLLELAR